MLLLLAVCILLLLLYKIFAKNSYWKNKGVPGPTPLPLFGNIVDSFLGEKNVSEIYADIYHKFQDCPFVGIYNFGEPYLLLRDPEIIKNVIIKDFNHFVDNDVHADIKIDPLLGRNPFALKGEEWKKARQFVTPNFASGKIKAMFPLAVHISNNFIKHLEKSEGATLDVKRMLLRYSCDVLAICAFGIEENCFKNPDAKFLNLLRDIATPDPLMAVKWIVSFLLPQFATLKQLPKSFDEGLIALTDETLRYRKEHNIERKDYFDVISHTPLSLVEMAAYLSVLILDGSETTSTGMTFIFYELANNLDCQTKLRKEIHAVLKKFDGEFSYEAMQNMPYLEACVNESLRMHPPLGQLTRVCVENYKMTSTSGEFRNLSVNLKKGDSLLIPLLGLHRDPKYFPSPNKFMPERFLDKNESHKHVYMPFGNGPRMCLGSRFGLMQAKVAVAQVIRHFEITLDPKTIVPFRYETIFFTLHPKDGVWLRCKKAKDVEDEI